MRLVRWLCCDLLDRHVIVWAGMVRGAHVMRCTRCGRKAVVPA